MPYRDNMCTDTSFWTSDKERETKSNPTDPTLYQQFHGYNSSICNQNPSFMSIKQLQVKRLIQPVKNLFIPRLCFNF